MSENAPFYRNLPSVILRFWNQLQVLVFAGCFLEAAALQRRRGTPLQQENNPVCLTLLFSLLLFGDWLCQRAAYKGSRLVYLDTHLLYTLPGGGGGAGGQTRSNSAAQAPALPAASAATTASASAVAAAK